LFALTPSDCHVHLLLQQVGCGGSLIVSAVVTAILLLLLGVVELAE
jgi:hypothetical protein